MVEMWVPRWSDEFDEAGGVNEILWYCLLHIYRHYYIGVDINAKVKNRWHRVSGVQSISIAAVGIWWWRRRSATEHSTTVLREFCRGLLDLIQHVYTTSTLSTMADINRLAAVRRKPGRRRRTGEVTDRGFRSMPLGRWCTGWGALVLAIIRVGRHHVRGNADPARRTSFDRSSTYRPTNETTASKQTCILRENNEMKNWNTEWYRLRWTWITK
jgi:hypothetical protein